MSQRSSSRTFLEFAPTSRELFENLGKALAGPGGAPLKNKDVFLVALTWGFFHDTKSGPIKKSGTGVRVEYLDDEDLALIRSIHYAVTQDLDALSDADAGFEIAELFAEGGIQLLSEQMKRPGDFAEAFAAEIVGLLGIAHNVRNGED